MKSLVLSAMICAAAVGNSVATSYATTLPPKGNNKELMTDQKSVAAFKQVIAFHQRNVDMLWEQYRLAKARMKESRGNHAELDRDKAFFIGVYQQDIENGIRVEAAKKAIEEIEAIYAEKHAQRDAYESQQLAQLQAHLKSELKREKKRFEKAKKKYAALINEETLPLLREAEQHFTKAIARANSFVNNEAIIAAR